MNLNIDCWSDFGAESQAWRAGILSDAASSGRRPHVGRLLCSLQSRPRPITPHELINMLLLYTIMVLRHGATPECVVEAATSRVGSGRRAQDNTTVLHYIAR